MCTVTGHSNRENTGCFLTAASGRVARVDLVPTAWNGQWNLLHTAGVPSTANLSSRDTMSPRQRSFSMSLCGEHGDTSPKVKIKTALLSGSLRYCVTPCRVRYFEWCDAVSITMSDKFVIPCPSAAKVVKFASPLVAIPPPPRVHQIRD